MIVFLEGPINAGKSTAGALLTRRLSHTEHIEVDQLRHIAGCLTLRQAIPHALTDAASLATADPGRGFHVVVTWPIDQVNEQRFAAAVAGSGVPLFTLPWVSMSASASRSSADRLIIPPGQSFYWLRKELAAHDA